MGLRFRKSVNCGAFRVNFSKTGIGYSIGGKGFRYTITADGRERVTLSIPGTGISYVEEPGRKRDIEEEYQNAMSEGRVCEIKNESIEKLSGDEYKEFISQCQNYLDVEKSYTNGYKISLAMSIVFFLLSVLKVYSIVTGIVCAAGCIGALTFQGLKRMLYKKRITLKYSFDETPNPYTISKNLIEIITGCESLKCVTSITSGAKGRIHAGATELFDMKDISISKKCPKLIDTNIDTYYVKFPQEEYFILPDKILIIKDYKIGAINPNSLLVEYSISSFRETEKVPSDTEIVGYTWQYVNNNGSPDRRYNNNRQIPICKYGKLHVSNKDGIDIILVGSNNNIIERFYDEWREVVHTSSLNRTIREQDKENIKEDDEEKKLKEKIYKALDSLQQKYEILISELYSQKELFIEEKEVSFLNGIISKGYMTENFGVTIDVRKYDFSSLSTVEIDNIKMELESKYLGIISDYEAYQKDVNINENSQSNYSIGEEYEKLIEDVKEDYIHRPDNGLLWCDLCQEINLWTYWQGRGNQKIEILLVGQDWGCAFDSNFEKMKNVIEQMNNGNDAIDYAENTNNPTDMHLIELFKVLGYDLHKKNPTLFFTNLALGYRKNGTAGGLKKEWLTDDVKYLLRLVNIVQPKLILCLGKDTYEVVSSSLNGKKIQIERFYEALENNSNYADVKLESGENVRVYAVAHCGSYGIMNRKKYASQLLKNEDGLELQKQDWLKIKEYWDIHKDK